MGEKGNAVDFTDASGKAGDAGRGLLGDAGAKAATEATGAAGARGEGGESTSEMIGSLVAKTGGEFLAGAALGAATEKLEDRSERKKAARRGSAEH